MGLEELDIFDSKVKRLDWRCRCHAFYKKYTTNEECLTNPPPGMELNDWRDLIAHFKSKSFQVISKKFNICYKRYLRYILQVLIYLESCKL